MPSHGLEKDASDTGDIPHNTSVQTSDNWVSIRILYALQFQVIVLTNVTDLKGVVHLKKKKSNNLLTPTSSKMSSNSAPHCSVLDIQLAIYLFSCL